MAATVIDGKALAAATKAEAAEKVRELKSRGINPCLAVILVGENPASQVSSAARSTTVRSAASRAAASTCPLTPRRTPCWPR